MSLPKQAATSTNLDFSMILFFASIILFYGIRWGVTGRIKPLWPKNN
jgi:hypothetical protein